MDPELTRAAMVLSIAFVIGAVAVLGLIVVHREALRRGLLRAVDPRPLALWRIAFGVCLLLGALEVAPLNAYLYSDEGLLPSAAVGQVYGKAALAGYGDGVRAPAGFNNGAAVVQFVTSGRWSLLYFWDSPAFVRGYFAVFLLACVMLVIGWRTRAATVVAWLLYVGMLRRGDAHWGGEQVFCGFLFLLMLARAGEAFSVDNWLRCRRLRRLGLLSEPGGPGDGAGAVPGPGHVQGLAAIYRRVPAWPQVLVAVQLAICYAANGWAKAGAMWAAGDSLAYVLHLDRHVRFDFHGLALVMGEWPLRLATWGVLWWERLFPLVLVGLWLRGGGRVGAGRVWWWVLAGALGLAASVPVGLDAGDRDVAGGARAGVLAAVVVGIVIAVVMAERRVSVGGVVIDRAWFARWPLGAWVWLGFGVVFHAVNWLTLNVGMFALATMSAYLLCGAGDAAVAVVQRGMRWLARWVAVPKHLSRETAIAAEDPSLPQLWRDDAALPGWAVAVGGAVVLVGGGVAVRAGEVLWWHAAWLSVGTGSIVLGRRVARRRGGEVREPWAYGPAGRTLAGGVAVYHLVALLVWQLPGWPALAWRGAARGLVDPWMELTFTRQLWGMFSPNVPGSNVAMRTVVIDAAGVEHDLRTELELADNLRRPYVWHDRWRKVDENVAGGRKELTPWHARYLCRRWELERGEAARAVVLDRVKAAVAPWELRGAQASFWARAVREPILRVDCRGEVFAQVDDEVRARHGLGAAADGVLKYSWPERQVVPEPWTPWMWLLALGLVGAGAAWAREDRRRKAAQATARRLANG